MPHRDGRMGEDGRMGFGFGSASGVVSLVSLGVGEKPRQGCSVVVKGRKGCKTSC